MNKILNKVKTMATTLLFTLTTGKVAFAGDAKQAADDLGLQAKDFETLGKSILNFAMPIGATIVIVIATLKIYPIAIKLIQNKKGAREEVMESIGGIVIGVLIVVIGAGVLVATIANLASGMFN